jgi:hypothetical protein
MEGERRTERRRHDDEEIADRTVDVSVGFAGSASSSVELHLDMRYQDSTPR